MTQSTMVNRKELAKALDKVKGARPKRAFLPILENVLLESKGDALQLSATDLEVYIRTSVKATGGECTREWALCVPLDMLRTAIKSGAETVELAVGGGQLTIRNGAGSMVIRGDDSKDWPAVPSVEGMNFTAWGLATVLKRVAHAMQADGYRPTLHGMSLALLPGNVMEVAAADGFRLTVMRGTHSADIKDEVRVILPFVGVVRLSKVLTEEAVSVVLADKDGWGNMRISFTQGDTEIICELVQGSFPNYQQLIPDNPPHKCKVSVRELLQAVNGAKDVAKEGSGIVRLASVDGKLLQVQAKHGDNVFNAEMPCEGDIKVALNWKYLTDMLKVLEGEKVTIKTTNTSSPVKIVEGEYIEVIMPMFVQW